MTLIVLLILAAVSLSAVFSEKGIFSRAEKAGNKYNEAKAREVLETVLLADGQYEKHSNPKYNQDDFLDDLIKSQIEGSDIKGDVAIVGEYAFELDRSVPKIGRYLGLAKDLVWPTVEIISEPTLINNGREATFTAKATEETKGITRIELWLNGKRIEKETITYDTPQTEIIKEFTVNKNGKYTIKAYADLMGSTKTTVEGIVPAVSFSPNGSEEWKKEQTTQIIVEETAETITEMKYVWIKDNGENEPADNLFTEDCLNNRTVTGGNTTMTGQYYLWVMIKTGTGENIRTNKYSSNAFNFDNEGPKSITAVLTQKSGDIYTLNIDCIKGLSDISKINIINNGEKKELTKQNETKWSVEITNTPNYINDTIFEVIYPSGDIFTYSTATKQNYTEMWDITIDRTYSWKWGTTEFSGYVDAYYSPSYVVSMYFNSKTGKFDVKSETREGKRTIDLNVGDIVRHNLSCWNITRQPVIKCIRTVPVENRNATKFYFVIPEVTVTKEEKLKGENLLGIQFCANSNELMAQGVNTYMNKEYYCVRKDT